MPRSSNKTSPSQSSSKKNKEKQCLGDNFKAQNLVPGLIIGFVCGFLFNISKKPTTSSSSSSSFSKNPSSTLVSSTNNDLKMVLVVRQDLKMGTGKIASQCAHAATAMYSQLIHSHRSLLRQWEHCGQAKIVVTCKNQQEMNKLKDEADSIGLPTFTVADAGRTQVAAGSKTVLAIGPGSRSAVDSVTGKLRLL